MPVMPGKCQISVYEKEKLQKTRHEASLQNNFLLLISVFYRVSRSVFDDCGNDRRDRTIWDFS